MGTVAQLYDSLAEPLNDMRLRADDTFGTIECKAKELSKCQEYKQSRKRMYAKLFPNDSSSSDAFASQDSSAKFNSQTFFFILDTLHNELARRRAANDDFYNQFKVFCRFSEMSYNEIVDCASQLIAGCSELRSEFSDELAHFMQIISKQPKAVSSRHDALFTQ